MLLVGVPAVTSRHRAGGHHGRGHQRSQATSVASAVNVTTPADWPANKSVLLQAPLSGTIFMHCPVAIGQDFQVSWVRLPDWRIIASGRTTYANDERFRVLHVDGTEEWALQIRYLTLEDHGLYECQVSTGTGIVTYYYNLTISVPSTSISGGSEYYVDRGSAMELNCIINNVPEMPQFVFWYHHDRMINYESMDKNRIHVFTGIGSPGEDNQQVISQLTIRNVSDADSGNYTCAPSNAPSANTLVYVSEGDEAAAIQGVDSNVSVSSSAISWYANKPGIFAGILLVNHLSLQMTLQR